MATNPKRVKVEQKGTISSKYQFKWVIDNFCTGCKNVGDALKSPIFTTMSDSGIILWYLKMYPKGDREEYKEFLSLYVSAINMPVKAVVTLEILNIKGEVKFTRTMKEHLFKFNEWGYHDLISRKSIMNPENNILNDDGNLTIVCKITQSGFEEMKDDKSVSEERENKESVFVLRERLEEIDKYMNLINDSKFSDVSLISSEGKVVNAHKCILAKSSSVFAAMFNLEMKEKHENKVKIEDIKYDVLLEMIHYIYAGKVKCIDAKAAELAAAADKYALNGLKHICEKTMCEILNVDNVVESLRIADRHRMTKLKKEAIEFLIAHTDDVKDQTEFLLLPPNIMHDLWCVTANKVKK